ncbi:conjugative transposon protein TraM [Sphingobacterium siyangense]|uniref:conjugative transposon protein TraM n=1 Tax=Sphingobacterium siyangense TaxID=459529 RepID=UPI0028A1905F|nr:conjugative transposon protein TraM [Sphingobacterium siyangense]
MKKINFRQGKYILPLIFFPFFFLAFYLYTSFAGKKNTEIVLTKDINSDLTPPSASVTQGEVFDKLKEYKKNYKYGDGYTAITPLQEETKGSTDVESLYSNEEKRLLDSLENELAQSRKVSPSKGNSGFRPRTEKLSETDQMLLGLMKQSGNNNNLPQEAPRQAIDPAEMMRKQFHLLDSFEKANDPKHQEKLVRDQKDKELRDEQVRIEASQFAVRKTKLTNGLFNTIMPEGTESFIKAIIDEDITAYGGSRIKIKLMEDILVGNEIIKKGTYLYGIINGFSQQRITLKITSVLKGNKILPINLDIYDVDGIMGLYVPASAFREFTKQLGGTSLQGMNISTSSTEEQSQFLMSTIQKAFQSTSQAISNALRQNKAKLKYSTFIYLIDSQEMKKQAKKDEKTN